MKQYLYAIPLGLLLGCASTEDKGDEINSDTTAAVPSSHSKEPAWSGSGLSDQAQSTIQTATQAYHRCLGEAMSQQTQQIQDSRRATQVLITQCEPKLQPVRTQLLAEQVPASVADRFLRRKRVQATRQVLRQMMYVQSAQQTRQTGQE